MDFMVTFDKNGNLVFANGSMERNWDRVREFYSRTGTYFKISISEAEKSSTEAQHRLFKRMCMIVSQSTGQDYHQVEREFLKLAPTKDVEGLFGPAPERRLSLNELTTGQFRDFLERVLIEINDITGSDYILYHDERLGTVFTKRSE